jgi:hypothetical protein
MGTYHMGTLSMNQLRNDYTDGHGHTYRYDSDYDCYYRVYTRDEYAELPHWDKYSWLYCVAVLAAICYYIEFIH